MGKFSLDYVKYGFLFALFCFVCYVVYQFWQKIADVLGITKSDSEAKAQATQESNVQSNIVNSSKVIASTKTDAEWKSIADTLYADLTAGFTNSDDAGIQITRVKNDTDFWKLFDAFGQRQDYYFGFQSGDTHDLTYFVHTKIPDKISAINNNYISKSMKFRF